MQLDDAFEKVFVISLADATARRGKLALHLRELEIVRESRLTWVRAISGSLCPPPGWFRAGGGAWGCLSSHLRIAQDAAMDRLHSYCVLEDDVLFRAESATLLERFQHQLPADWDQLYLGGQHLKPPTKVAGFVLRGNNINRTHAYCIKHTIIEHFQRHIIDAPSYIRTQRGWHIDHQLGSAHERMVWNTYCPAWWLAGQRAGVSNISGRQNPSYWWHRTDFIGLLPFVHCAAGSSPNVVPEAQHCIHFGNNLKPGTLQDVGLDTCVKHPDLLAKWLVMIAGEALEREQLPGIEHPTISLGEVADCWKGIVLSSQSADIQRIHTETYEGLLRQSLE